MRGVGDPLHMLGQPHEDIAPVLQGLLLLLGDGAVGDAFEQLLQGVLRVVCQPVVSRLGSGQSCQSFGDFRPVRPLRGVGLVAVGELAECAHLEVVAFPFWLGQVRCLAGREVLVEFVPFVESMVLGVCHVCERVEIGLNLLAHGLAGMRCLAVRAWPNPGIRPCRKARRASS